MNQGAEKLMKPESNNESNNHESKQGGEGIRGRLERFFAFDRHDMRYELTEREAGEPKSFGGWKDIAPQGEPDFRPVPADINDAEAELRNVFRADINTDVIFRRLNIAGKTPALIVYMNGMASDETIADFIMRPLMTAKQDADTSSEGIINNILQVSEIGTESDLNLVITAITDGKAALFVQGESEAVIPETRGFEKRSVSTTENEKIVHGPKEGFTENLRTNITLVRRIIHSDDLVVEFRPAGCDNNIRIAVMYRDGVANRTLIEEVKRRLAKVNTRTIIDTGMLDQLIEGDGFSPIPQTLATERPDRVASFIMQGAVSIIADGSPFALIMPITLSALMNSPEDIYMRKPLGTLLRIVRYAGVLISLLLPGYFVALALYHQGLLSTEVLSTVIQSRKMVFEPLPFEMLLLLFVFQLIREAGMRVPGSIGQAIGVIGGLILGQAAVAANLASSVMLIIVALSGLGNFCVPDYSTQIAASYFRIAFVIAAWLGGLLGLAAALVVFAAYLANMKSFGVPFLAPFAPKTLSKRPFVIRGKLGMHHRAEDYMNTHGDTLPKQEGKS